VVKRWLRRLFSTRKPVTELPYDPDGDGEGLWVKYIDTRPVFAGKVSWTWMADVLMPEERCESEICLFGREWIGCKKRRGHKGIHRNCETWAWDEGDERA
jgi:hypothetical protein